MNKPAQWLFEAAPLLEMPRRTNRSLQKGISSQQTIVLQSDRFRGDQRLQASANNRPPLRRGERSNAVRKLQQALIDLGYPMPITTKRGTQPPDGIYGNETTTTVRQFQSKYGLKIDGIAGRATLSKLDQLFTKTTPLVCSSFRSNQCEKDFERCLKTSNNPLACLAARSVCYQSCSSPPSPPPSPPSPSTPPPAPLPIPSSTPPPPTARTCCILASTLSPFSSASNLVSPKSLGVHGSSSEATGLIYTGKAGFFDLGHVRDLCDLTKYVYDQIVAVKGVPVTIRTMHGTAIIHKPVSPSDWIQVARAISYDDSFGYEIFTYNAFSPGGHNSSFSPEDLCSNYLGSLLAEKAILAGGSFNGAVTSQLNTMLGLLDAQTVAESLNAFNLINGCWVNFNGPGNLLQDDYLKRRNFDRIPWFTGHPSDSSSPAWVTVGFGSATSFYTYTHTMGRTINKADFSKEIARIRIDAAKRYGPKFDDRKCP